VPLFGHLLSVLVLLHLHAPGDSNRQPIGIVDRVDGRWQRVQDRQPLIRGDLMFEDETVTTGKAESGSLVVLLFRAQGAIWRQDCPCDGSYRPPVDRKSSFWVFLSTYWSEDRRLPGKILGSRGIDDNVLQDAVVIRAADHLTNLTPAFTHITSGTYQLKLIPAPESAKEKSLVPQERTLEIRSDKVVQIEGLQTGLYLATLTRADAEPSSFKLLLVADQSDRALLDKWEQVKKMVKDWNADHPETVEILVARSLYSLDAHSSPAH
jgi:hypothetical protein